MEQENKMRELLVEKVTLNVGVGEPGERLEKIKDLLEQISGARAVKTRTNKRIPEWNIRPDLEIGVKTTVRGEQASELLKRLLQANENSVRTSNFDSRGNLSFGISEYIHIPGARYDYTVGIVGLSVAVTITRRGFAIARGREKRKIGRKHLISREEATEFIKKRYNVSVV